MLCGSLPFVGKTEDEKESNILRGNYSYKGKARPSNPKPKPKPKAKPKLEPKPKPKPKPKPNPSHTRGCLRESISLSILF